MSAYGWAWLIVAAMVPLALFALHRAMRGAWAPRTRLAVLVLLGAVLLLPAPVPSYPGHYAPAFLVFAFESLFQRPGEPGTAGLILAAGAAATLAVIVLIASRRRRRPEDTTPP